MSYINEVERIKMSWVPYALEMASFMFFMLFTRPNIAQAIEAVNRYMENPDIKHWNTIKRILRYIKSTLDVVLYYRGWKFTIKEYIDSDFLGALEKRRFIIGYIFIILDELWVGSLNLRLLWLYPH